jgi:hypothetical protein
MVDLDFSPGDNFAGCGCRNTACDTPAAIRLLSFAKLTRKAFASGRRDRLMARSGFPGFAHSGAPFRAGFITDHQPPATQGLGAGVGRGLGVGTDLGVGVALGVDVGVGVAVGVTLGVTVEVAVAVGVTLTVAVAVAVAVAVGLAVAVGVGEPSPDGDTRTK